MLNLGLNIFLRAAILAFVLNASPKVVLCAEKQWEFKYRESFEKVKLPSVAWHPNKQFESGPYSDEGSYFKKLDPNFKSPESFRASLVFGEDSWLKLETYSRTDHNEPSEHYSIVPDPSGLKNKVLKITSPFHSDGTVLRSRVALPSEYRVCARVGYADFGTGKPVPDRNGYQGGERAEPWKKASSGNENGFYWLAILSDEPRPRNNTWIHHHRKAVIDSDNNWYPPDEGGPWTRIWNGSRFEVSGEHPVMVFVLDKDHKDKVWNYDRTGQPFISWAANQWNVEAESGEIRAVDAYKDNTWYKSCIQKANGEYRLSVEGDFKFGGVRKYESSIPLSRVFESEITPDYFMMGDPHINYYAGSVYYDDVTLEVRK